MENRMTVLESIIQDVAKALFQKWANALPEDQRSERNNCQSKQKCYRVYILCS
jgi:hypothetical protein